MKPLAILLIPFSLTSCSGETVRSICAEQPALVMESRTQLSKPDVGEPLLSTSIPDGEMITIGRNDAYRLLAERLKRNPDVANSVASLRLLLDEATRSGVVLDADPTYPELSTLQGKELDEAILVKHELIVLFTTALAQGEAKVGSSDSPVSLTIQRYRADLPGGRLWGFRTTAKNALVYDYCGVTPGGT